MPEATSVVNCPKKAARPPWRKLGTARSHDRVVDRAPPEPTPRYSAADSTGGGRGGGRRWWHTSCSTATSMIHRLHPFRPVPRVHAPEQRRWSRCSYPGSLPLSYGVCESRHLGVSARCWFPAPARDRMADQQRGSDDPMATARFSRRRGPTPSRDHEEPRRAGVLPDPRIATTLEGRGTDKTRPAALRWTDRGRRGSDGAFASRECKRFDSYQAQLSGPISTLAHRFGVIVNCQFRGEPSFSPRRRFPTALTTSARWVRLTFKTVPSSSVKR
jgi:hypothetical protein